MNPLNVWGARRAAALAMARHAKPRPTVREVWTDHRRKVAAEKSTIAAAAEAYELECSEWGRLTDTVQRAVEDFEPVPYVPTMRAYLTDADRQFLSDHGVSA